MPFLFDLIELFFLEVRECVQSEVKFGPQNLWLRGLKPFDGVRVGQNHHAGE
jgi:hypothetical protein